MWSTAILAYINDQSKSNETSSISYRESKMTVEKNFIVEWKTIVNLFRLSILLVSSNMRLQLSKGTYPMVISPSFPDAAAC